MPFILLLTLCVAMMAYVLTDTSKEANRLDLAHAREAVSAALDDEVERIKLLADDNALWDDAARAVYGQPDQAFLWTSWGASTGESANYSLAAVIDQDGRTLMAFEGGRAIDADLVKTYGAPLRELLRQASATKAAAGGVIRHGDGLMAMGVEEIMPISRDLERLVPVDGPYRLVFGRPLTDTLVASISKRTNLPDLRLAAETAAGDDWPTVSDPTGHDIAKLVWTPSAPGARALRAAQPKILFALFVGMVLAGFVIRQWIKLIREFRSEALTDSLSGLPNRRALRFDLQSRLARQEPLALAMLDLDGFKAVNDRFGHLAGDRLINEVSALLQSKVGPKGKVARLGGDEFAILLPGPAARDAVEGVAKELLTRFLQPFRLDDRTTGVGVSIGMVESEQGVTASELMRRADVALYTAKRAGKMRFRWYTHSLDEAQARARSIESDLRTALEKEQFGLVYQPLFDHLGGTVRAVEALLRWRRPGGEPVEPGEFIPIAEYSGLIDKIGLWVIRRACLDGMAWPRINVAVNVSMAQLRNPEFPDLLAQVLEETGFPPIRLELEVSERFLVSDTQQARKMIDAIRALGVSVVLDEFGSGLTSLGFLRSFNFSKLKVDRSLTAEAQANEATRNVVQSSVAVARALGMAVTIGGVENQEQADLMRVAGCDELQGWHLSGELESAEISALILRNSRSGGRQRRS
ncbi:MAG TPA: EAL domain-containing protein [Chakrabartia sp.]|nr:EAL domain-containing protein [Chakrabartia sp.]